MPQYKVVKLKESKRLAEELEEILNDHSQQGWEFVEMERAHRTAAHFFLLVFRKS